MKMDKIVEIEQLEDGDTVDIEVDGNHLFYANDILTHNSSYDKSSPDMSSVSESIAISQIASTMIGVVLDEHRPDIRICSVLKSRKVNKAKIKPVIVNANTERQTLSDLTDSDKRVYLKQEQKEVLQEMNNIVEKAEEIEKCPEKGKSILDSILNI